MHIKVSCGRGDEINYYACVEVVADPADKARVHTSANAYSRVTRVEPLGNIENNDSSGPT